METPVLGVAGHMSCIAMLQSEALGLKDSGIGAAGAAMAGPLFS